MRPTDCHSADCFSLLKRSPAASRSLDIAASNGVRFERVPAHQICDSAGFWDREDKKVLVSQDLDPAMTVGVISHELRHAIQDGHGLLELWDSTPPSMGLAVLLALEADANVFAIAVAHELAEAGYGSILAALTRDCWMQPMTRCWSRCAADGWQTARTASCVLEAYADCGGHDFYAAYQQFLWDEALSIRSGLKSVPGDEGHYRRARSAEPFILDESHSDGAIATRIATLDALCRDTPDRHCPTPGVAAGWTAFERISALDICGQPYCRDGARRAFDRFVRQASSIGHCLTDLERRNSLIRPPSPLSSSVSR